MVEKRMSRIAIINNERSYANHILQESMDRITDIAGKKVLNHLFFKHLNLSS